MTGIEAIVEQIISDARKIVNSTLEEANKVADSAIELAKNDAHIYSQKNIEVSTKEREEIITRRKTVANLEVKKEILQVKQDLVNKAFDSALMKIKSDKKLYAELLGAMLKYAENGDSVIIAKTDAKLMTKKFVAENVPEGVVVTVSKDYGDFVGGIILNSEKADKNLTLEVELKSLREEIEPKIAKILFGE